MCKWCKSFSWSTLLSSYAASSWFCSLFNINDTLNYRNAFNWDYCQPAWPELICGIMAKLAKPSSMAWEIKQQVSSVSRSFVYLIIYLHLYLFKNEQSKRMFQITMKDNANVEVHLLHSHSQASWGENMSTQSGEKTLINTAPWGQSCPLGDNK